MHLTCHASSSRGNLYSVESGPTRLLLECGLPVRQIRRYVGSLAGVDGILLTHEHGDHARSAAELGRRGVPVYCSAGTAEALGRSVLRPLRAREQVQIGGISVLPLEAQHDAAEPLAFVLDDGTDRLLFATDTAYPGWRVEGLTMIAVEANYHPDLLPADMPPGQRQRLAESHMGLPDTLKILRTTDLSRVREIHLLHLSDAHSDAERFKREVQAATGVPTFVAPRG